MQERVFRKPINTGNQTPALELQQAHHFPQEELQDAELGCPAVSAELVMEPSPSVSCGFLQQLWGALS